MPTYSHPGLSTIQKLKAKWRTLKLTATQTRNLVEQDHLNPLQATKLVQRQHNEHVRKTREANDQAR